MCEQAMYHSEVDNELRLQARYHSFRNVTHEGALSHKRDRHGRSNMKHARIRFIAALPLAETTVVIEDGTARLKRGKPQAVLLDELSEWAATNQIEAACIHATMRTGAPKLSFYGVPQALHQQLRNVWLANAR